MLGSIRCPVLAIQGEDDAYGTMAQIVGIATRVPQAELLSCPGAGMRRTATSRNVIAAVARLLHRPRRSPASPLRRSIAAKERTAS